SAGIALCIRIDDVHAIEPPYVELDGRRETAGHVRVCGAQWIGPSTSRVGLVLASVVIEEPPWPISITAVRGAAGREIRLRGTERSPWPVRETHTDRSARALRGRADGIDQKRVWHIA